MKSEESKLTPENVANILREKGLEVSVNQAKEILELLYTIAKLEVKQHLKNEDR